MANRVNRRKSRAIAMELLYSGTVNERDVEITDEFLDDFSSISDTTEVLDKAYIRQVVELAEAREGHFRKVLTPFLRDWDIKRISRINLAILKISVTELLYMMDIPPRVSVNEAIELAKTYSDEESTAFINGVLDKVLKAMQDGAIPEWTPELEAMEAAELAEEPGAFEPAGETPEELSGSLPEAGAGEPGAEEPDVRFEELPVDLPEELPEEDTETHVDERAEDAQEEEVDERAEEGTTERSEGSSKAAGSAPAEKTEEIREPAGDAEEADRSDLNAVEPETDEA